MGVSKLSAKVFSKVNYSFKVFESRLHLFAILFQFKLIAFCILKCNLYKSVL